MMEHLYKLLDGLNLNIKDINYVKLISIYKWQNNQILQSDKLFIIPNSVDEEYIFDFREDLMNNLSKELKLKLLNFSKYFKLTNQFYMDSFIEHDTLYEGSIVSYLIYETMYFPKDNKYKFRAEMY